jgi:N utilization substance protein A
MNSKELNLFLQMFANEHGIATTAAMDLVIDAFSAYASKTQSAGKGTFLTRFEDDKFVTFRVWELVADDVVMEDPERQWRVLDAVDEGFEEAEPGDEVEVQVQPVELSRTFSNWMNQFMLRKMAALRAVA